MKKEIRVAEAERVFLSEDAEKRTSGICGKFSEDRGNTVAILQEVQGAFGYLPEDVLERIAGCLEIPASRLFGVATFYGGFYFTPRGRNVITACSGSACHVKGSEKIINGLMRELGLSGDGGTTDDLDFTLEKGNCVGACSIAPVVVINKLVYGKATLEQVTREVRALKGKEADEGN